MPVASDYIFCVESNNNFFCIVSTKYWEEYHCCSDGDEDNDVEELLPEGFDNLMEGTWEYNGNLQEGIQNLEDAGFVFSEELQDWVNR